MLKTNSRQAIANLRGYILASWNIEPGEEERTWKETKEDIRKSFISQAYNSEYERRQNRQKAFCAWLGGLPRGLGDHLLCKGIETLSRILEETTEEANRYSEEQAQEKLSYLIYREVCK